MIALRSMNQTLLKELSGRKTAKKSGVQFGLFFFCCCFSLQPNPTMLLFITLLHRVIKQVSVQHHEDTLVDMQLIVVETASVLDWLSRRRPGLLFQTAQVKRRTS